MATEPADPGIIEPDATLESPEPVVAAETPAIETPPAPEPPRKDHWALRRISEESEKARQANERAAAADRRVQELERRAQEAEALAARAAGKEPLPPPSPRSEPQGDRQAEIRAEAARQRLYEDSSEVVNRGVAEYGPAFGEVQRALGALGATTDEFVLDVMAVDKANAHKLFKAIADDPERAVALASMSSRQRLVELAKMTAKPAPTPTPSPTPNALAPRKVSSAPAPAPKVTPSAAPAEKDGYADDASDADFDKQFYERWGKRTARR